MGFGRKLKKAVKSAGRRVAQAGGSIGLSSIASGVEGAAKALTPDINIPEPEKEKVMPIPDEEALARSNRRARLKQRARGRGGRSASVMSGVDTLG